MLHHVLGFSRETEPIWDIYVCIYIYNEIYDKELGHKNMEAVMSHGLPELETQESWWCEF